MKCIKQIKNYHFYKQIGKGATGVVYLGVDNNTNQLVAVKALPATKIMNDKRVMDNLKRELKLLHGLNHTNIIKILGVEKTKNNLYLILEYCNGGNLFDYLYYHKHAYKAPLPEKFVQKITRQLIEGLEYMHNCQTVHRDIKLENILINFNKVNNEIKNGQFPEDIKYENFSIDDDLSIKIADLGYARELEGDGVASTICGTPITMAPDIINLFDQSGIKDHKYNNKVDLWSLGAITYELLIGRPPFYSSNSMKLFQEIMKGNYTLPKNLKLSVEAISFINGLLQFFPEKRMSWNEIRYHPFLAKEVSTFHLLDLQSLESEYANSEQLLMNTKDCDNFLWLMFKNNGHNLPLDKVGQEIYNDPIMNQIPSGGNVAEKKKDVDVDVDVTDHKEIEIEIESEHITSEMKNESSKEIEIRVDKDKDKENPSQVELQVEEIPNNELLIETNDLESQYDVVTYPANEDSIVEWEIVPTSPKIQEEITSEGYEVIIDTVK